MKYFNSQPSTTGLSREEEAAAAAEGGLGVVAAGARRRCRLIGRPRANRCVDTCVLEKKEKDVFYGTHLFYRYERFRENVYPHSCTLKIENTYAHAPVCPGCSVAGA